MSYNWRKHLKKNTKDHAPFVVNTNTNIIFKFVENEKYISKKDQYKQLDKNGMKIARTSAESSKYLYVRVKPCEIVGAEEDSLLDYNKTFPKSRVKKYLTQGYFIECRNYKEAVYHQAILRMEKTDGPAKEEWRIVAENIQNEYPEMLL